MDRPKKINLGYSLKNIPIHSAKTYRTHLIDKVESVIRRMRWKAHFFLKGTAQDSERGNQHYGFKSRASAPPVLELKAFEADLVKLVEDIRFRKVEQQFQTDMENDLKTMKTSGDIIVKADKTKNLYKLSANQYDKLVHDNITKNYKLAPDSQYDVINAEAKAIANDLHLADRMDVLARSEAFLTLKDHKPRFENDLPCRLINPAKPEMGKVSKSILDGINRAVRVATGVNQWKNTASVIEWFSSITEKNRHTFVSFDIVEFYPSINEELLHKALLFAQQFIDIPESDIAVIMHARQSLLFQKGKAWVKKGRDSAFDVTMGSFDGAEICELVGVFILNKLTTNVDKTAIGLYRDDGLAVLKDVTGSAADRFRKDVTQIFKEFGLRITIDVNLHSVNFLDVTFDLATGQYKPYRKPDDSPLYINIDSNHPPTILKNLPKNISQRVSSISSDREVFADAMPLYRNALAASGFYSNMEFADQTDEDRDRKKKARKRHRNVIWFNPPFSRNVATNVGGEFLKLITKHFPKNSALSKIFNRNTLKVSYSCLPNVAAMISSHNNKQLRTANEDKPCNCRKKAECPLEGNCQHSEIVYEAQIAAQPSTPAATYIGSTETTFKLRYNNHTSSFRNAKYKTSTELSKRVWALKDRNENHQITWKIKETAKAYSPTTKRCSLCLAEKRNIVEADKATCINTRNEMFAKCRHATKYLLSNFKGVT